MPTTISSILLSCDAIICSNPAFVKLLTLKNRCSLSDYAGSLFIRKDVKGREVPILCLAPLKQLVSTKPGKFLCKRFLSKIFKKEDWPTVPAFQWELCDDNKKLSDCHDVLSNCDYISCDIETSPAFRDRVNKRDPQHIIVCVAYSAITFDRAGNEFSIRTYVIPLSSIEALHWIRKINLLPQPKIFQNGKYDNFYFLRFNLPVSSWYFDTLELHHSFLSELPKNLGYLAAFYIREISYWKDEGQTGDLFDLYKYNAKDAWATTIVFLTQIKEFPPWAINNYLIKFPLVYPCLTAELDGLLIDKQVLIQQTSEQTQKLSTNLSSLGRKLGSQSFNPSSPKQVLSLLHLLGNRDLTSSQEKDLEKAADRHPLYRLLIDEIISYRESAKLINTYLEAELWNGKLLYSLNPSGTDTGRLASRESSLWCGTQLQNLPGYYKQAIWAEEGFFLGEGDFEQSETRCVAYLSGDENLLAAVQAEKDFHGINASNFFGIPYDQIMKEAREAKGTATESKTKRYLVKRVGHGANYGMGAQVLLDTIGAKVTINAQKLLSLPRHLTPKQICEVLLKRYFDTYPIIKGEWYASIVTAIRISRMLVSSLGWTRLCFGNPWNNKHDLNSYIAHVPSNLSVGIINEAFLEIFQTLHLKSNGDFRLKGQVHDSIVFSYKEGREDLVEEVRSIMTRPKQIIDCKGKTRQMTIPVALKGNHRCWAKLETIVKR